MTEFNGTIIVIIVIAFLIVVYPYFFKKKKREIPSSTESLEPLIQHSSKHNKALGILLVFSIIFWVILLFWATFGKIIVNEKLFIYNWSNILAIAITIWMFVSMFNPDSRLRKSVEKSNKNIVVTSIAILIAMPFLVKITVEQGLPIFFHHVTKEPSQIEGVIEEKVSFRRCRQGVQLKGYDYFSNGRVCGLSKDILDVAEYGDKLILIGEKSPFGFTYSSYRFEKVSASQKNPYKETLHAPNQLNSKRKYVKISDEELDEFYDFINDPNYLYLEQILVTEVLFQIELNF